MRTTPDTSIVLFGDGQDWHGKTLRRAFKKRGITPLAVPLNVCGFSTKRATGLAIPGLASVLPQGAFVRFVPGGTFEEVTLYLGVLHALRELGVTVWNDARAIERCVDKSTTSFLLARAGIPTPPTWAMESLDAARELVRSGAGDGPFVLKPLFGSQGRGLRLIRMPDDLPAAEEIAGVYYLQGYVAAAQDGVFRDFRVFVSGGRAIAAMVRHATSWITNVKRGGRPMAGVIGGEIKDLAIRA